MNACLFMMLPKVLPKIHCTGANFCYMLVLKLKDDRPVSAALQIILIIFSESSKTVPSI